MIGAGAGGQALISPAAEQLDRTGRAAIRHALYPPTVFHHVHGYACCWARPRPAWLKYTLLLARWPAAWSPAPACYAATVSLSAPRPQPCASFRGCGAVGGATLITAPPAIALRAACCVRRQAAAKRATHSPPAIEIRVGHREPASTSPPNPRRCDRQLDSPSLKSRLSQNNALCIPDATRREEAGAASRLQSQESPRSGRRSPSPPRKTAQRRQSGRPMNKSLTAATSTPYSSHPPV